MNTLIIQSPQNQSILSKYTQSLMTAVLWVLWIYMLLPILEPLLVLIDHDIQSINPTENSLNFKQFMPVLTLIVSLIISCWLWSKYNTLLYHYRNKKNQEKSVRQSKTSSYFSVSPKELTYWQQLKQVTVKLTEQGDILNVSCYRSVIAITGGFNLRIYDSSLCLYRTQNTSCAK